MKETVVKGIISRKTHIYTIQSPSSALVTAQRKKREIGLRDRRCHITDRSSESGELQIAFLAS